MDYVSAYWFVLLPASSSTTWFLLPASFSADAPLPRSNITYNAVLAPCCAPAHIAPAAQVARCCITQFAALGSLCNATSSWIADVNKTYSSACANFFRLLDLLPLTASRGLTTLDSYGFPHILSAALAASLPACFSPPLPTTLRYITWFAGSCTLASLAVKADMPA